MASAWTAATRSEESPQVFRSRTDLVTVTATIVDRAGRPVTTLAREDFTVLEDGTRQDVAFVSAGEKAPISIGLVVDTSGSMGDKIDDVEDALSHFVATVTERDEVFVTTFADRVEPVLAFTGPSEPLRSAVTRLRPGGGTVLYDAVIDGIDRLSRGAHEKKALLLVTDGSDSDSRASGGDAERASARSDALLYAFGIGHGRRGSFGHDSFGHNPFGHNRFGRGQGVAREDAVDIGVLRRLADPTGGRAYLLEQAHSSGRDLIDEAVAEVARELRQQYTIGYYTTNEARDGKFRRIEIRVPNRDYTVRVRGGYWAPAGDARH